MRNLLRSPGYSINIDVLWVELPKPGPKPGNDDAKASII